MKDKSEEYRRNAEAAELMASRWPDGSDLQRAYLDIAKQWHHMADVAETYRQ